MTYCSSSKSNPYVILESYPPLSKALWSKYVSKYQFIRPSKEILKSKYKELALFHHPDKPTGSTERFQEISSAWDDISKTYDTDVTPEDTQMQPLEDCVWWYNSAVLKIPGMGRPNEGYVGNLVRVVGVTDDGVSGFYKLLAMVGVAIFVCFVAYLVQGRGRGGGTRVPGEGTRERREEVRKRREMSRLLRVGGDGGEVGVVESVRDVKYKEKNDRKPTAGSSSDDNPSSSTPPSSSRYVLPPSPPTPLPPTDLLLPTSTQPSFSALFPSLQASRLLLRTLSTNAISKPHSPLLGKVLSNLHGNGRVEKYYTLNVNRNNNFGKHVWRYKAFRALLLNLGFNENSEERQITLPYPMDSRTRRLIEVSIYELKGQPTGGGREVPVIEDSTAKTSTDLSLRVAGKTRVLFLGGGKANDRGFKEATEHEGFGGIDKLTFRVNSGVLREVVRMEWGNVVKLELSRLPMLKEIGSMEGMDNVKEVILDMCGLRRVPVLPAGVVFFSAKDNEIEEVEGAFGGGGKEVEEVDLRGNFLVDLPLVFSGMIKLRKTRMDGNLIKVDELVKFAMERKIKLC